MGSREILDLLRMLLVLPFRSFWPSAAELLDRLRDLGAFWTSVLAILVALIPAVCAVLLQLRLRAILRRSPGAAIGFLRFLRLELWYSIFALPLWPFAVLRALLRGLAGGIRWLGTKRRRRTPAQPQEEPAPASPPAAPEPLLVASLGPSFLVAGLITAGLYLVARLAEPLLRASLELSPGLSAWQYLFLGRRPELAWYLPLDRFPFLAGLLTTLVWAAVGSLVGIAVRLVFHGELGRNLARSREDRATLPLWRSWGGATFLTAPDRSYSEWAGLLLAVAVPLLAWAWLSLAGDPYRLRPSELAVALVLWTFWVLHLFLRGEESGPAVAPEEEPAARPAGNGWPEVLTDLERRLQAGEPEPFETRPLAPLAWSDVDPRTAGILSPLLAELLPAPGRLTAMQRTVLTRLALQGFVHTDPPVSLDQLSLGEAASDALEDRSGQRSRNLIVLAPEGTGKTTLALLAAANHALVHTRGTLIVVRAEAQAQALAERFRRAVEPSTLRWNVRVRHLGSDLMSDLAQGILPDVVICGLNGLVVTVLDQPDLFAPFLRSLGLILVDDVESFLGPVEVHAQLAFRRLTLRVAELTGARELGTQGKESAPQILALGAESLHRMPEWVRHLLGIDAVARSFSGAAGADAAARTGGGEQRFYRLRDFRTAAGEPLAMADLIAACERLGVPWHYRLCGDGRRELGRGPLLLREEPECFVEAPETACVVFLEGAWSEVRRERRRLERAGSRFRRQAAGEGGAAEGSEIIAFVTLVDPDEEMALTQLDKGFSLAAELEVLPRPVVRPPTGLAVGPHLAADLVRSWIEVEDAVRVFGSSAAPRLRRLAENGLLLCERRTDVDEAASGYVGKVHVRALARAVRSEEDGEEGDPGLLPPKVVQTDLTARRIVAVRDRASLVELARVDAASAHLAFYPGRIFQDARGVFVVVGRASEESGHGGLSGDVLVEPLLADEISSPRRTVQVRPLAAGEVSGELLENAGGAYPEPDVVLLGRLPFRVALEPVELSLDHIATYRLGPVSCEVRQRSLLDRTARERYRALSFSTVALTLFPNPREGAARLSEPAEALSFGGARLIAAALRALLPSVVRGASLSVRAALRLAVPGPVADDRLLGSDEGLLFFDAEAGGNGTVRALHREGFEPILRLCRLMIERVLSYDRLRALHDEWGDEAEVLADGAGSEGGPALRPEEARLERDRRARRDALVWLDSRLRPEGGAEAWRGTGQPGEGFESGEGDTFDLGRCWYSRDGGVADLLWVKHRWRLPGRGEAMLDIGFDRETAAQARALPGPTRLLEAYAADYRAWAEHPDGRLSDGSRRRSPRPVEHLSENGKPLRSGEAAETEAARALHALHLAAAAHTGPALLQLAAVLRERSGASPDTAEGRLRLASYVAAFVQGIPFSVRGELRSPVSTLLYRLGDAPAKSLLLAVLLHLCGIEAGLFVSPEEGHATAAAALPDPLPAGAGLEKPRAEAAEGEGETPPSPPATGSAGTPEAVERLAEWIAAAGLVEIPRFWAVLPAGPGDEEPGSRLFVPIEATAPCPVGLTVAERPRAWAFLPLTLLDRRLDLERLGPAPSDRAEYESRF